MNVRYSVLLGALLLGLCSAGANDKAAVNQAQFPPASLPSGELMYKQYCATCHGADAKGHGPAAGSLKTPPPDLTTLADRHDGKFPFSYVSDVLLLGPFAAHGSAAMPIWGPVFRYIDKGSETSVRQRIKNLSNYLASLQVRPRETV